MCLLLSDSFLSLPLTLHPSSPCFLVRMAAATVQGLAMYIELLAERVSADPLGIETNELLVLTAVCRRQRDAGQEARRAVFSAVHGLHFYFERTLPLLEEFGAV